MPCGVDGSILGIEATLKSEALKFSRLSVLLCDVIILILRM